MKDAEAKLQQILIKHNEQLAEVEAVKEQLNVGRRERVIYSTVFKGIEKDAILKQREFQNQIRQNELLKTEVTLQSTAAKIPRGPAPPDQAVGGQRVERIPTKIRGALQTTTPKGR